MSTNVPPAVVANQARAANNALGKVPNGVVPAPVLNGAIKANNAVMNGAAKVVNAQAQAVNAAANATTVPNKANQATVNKAIAIVNRTMTNLQNLKTKAAAANKNVVNAIIKNNAANGAV